MRASTYYFVRSSLLAGLVLTLCSRSAHSDDPQPGIDDAPRLAATTEARSVARVSSPSDQTSNRHIQELIRKLGHPRFSERRAAASELRQIGPEAFDLLHAATSDNDPEVAASATYLLRQISVRWVQGDDSPAVRALLRNFHSKSEESRLSRINELARLSGGDGVAGLCRIARFDRSPLVARMAALAVIRSPRLNESRASIDSESVERELGESTRQSALWLRRYTEQLRDPAAAVGFWKEIVAEESARLEQNADDTSSDIVRGLLWNLADLHRQLDEQDAMLDVINNIFELDADDTQAVGIGIVDWLMKHQAWDTLDAFLTKHEPDFGRDKRLAYYAALGRAGQGKAELAEQLAEKASQLDPQGTLECFIAAKDLEEHRQFDWAVREYHRAIDEQPISEHESILARISLASMQHDYERHADAADVLQPLVNAVQNEGKIGQLYAELRRYYRGLSLPDPDTVAARFHYYRACQYRDADDRQRERGELELAIKFDPMDADVLIAMYRHPETDAAWRESVRRQIQELCRQFQQEINENPNDSSPYNQWAWLVSNTEGDFQQAIRYSHRSIELIPPDSGNSAAASFLDTLGRCYFAAGDYENAVKYQRQAIEKINYMQVMHRQLALFEKALADKRGAASNSQPADESNE